MNRILTKFLFEGVSIIELRVLGNFKYHSNYLGDKLNVVHGHCIKKTNLYTSYLFTWPFTN